MIFTHGAGGTLSAPAVVNFCNGYSSKLSIFVFQGGMNLGSRVKGFHACISHLDTEHEVKENKKKSTMTPYRELILGGRSMGARAAVIAATEDRARRSQTIPTHLVLVSYPLQGPKDVRDQILLDLDPNINVLFVVGDRDAMCPLDLLNEVRQKMKANKTWLIVVEGLDHGMHGGGAKKEKALGEETGRLVAKWVRWGDRSVIEKRMRWDEEEGMVKVVNVDV
jgi:predicted alpha/beta-hydrolase family hydrolase